MRLRYRLGQVRRRLGASGSADEASLASEVLTPHGFALFGQLDAGDRRHAVCVLRTVRAEGPCRPELAEAALLHDVGKAGGGLSLAHRCLATILASLCPGILARLARPEPRSWGYPFHVYLHHAEIGAGQCARIGCSPLTAYLVGHHDGQPDAEAVPADWRAALDSLRSADERC